MAASKMRFQVLGGHALVERIEFPTGDCDDNILCFSSIRRIDVPSQKLTSAGYF